MARILIVEDGIQNRYLLEVLFKTAQDVPLLLVGDPLRLGQVLLIGRDDFGAALFESLCDFRQGVIFYAGVDSRQPDRGRFGCPRDFANIHFQIPVDYFLLTGYYEIVNY